MLPPLVERELRIALRRGVRSQWLTAAATAAGLAGMFLLVGTLISAKTQGRMLFLWLFLVTGAKLVRNGFAVSADLISEECRQGTLGLLVLTGLRPLSIFAHKLFGATWLLFYSLVAVLPFFALPFVLGGLHPGDLLAAGVLLLNALWFCIAMGLLASVWNSEGAQAHLKGAAASTVLCLATPTIHWISRLGAGGPGLSDPWLALSPAYAPYLLVTGNVAAHSAAFWSSSGFTLACSLTALLLAAVQLNRNWRDASQPLASAASGPIQARKHTSFAGRARRLDRNPFCWLAARSRHSVRLAWILIAGMGLVWFGGWRLVGARWFHPATGLLVATLMHLALNWVAAYAAAEQLAEDRATGGLEILLTTPLSEAKILRGQMHALGIQFRKPLVAALLIDVICFVAGMQAMKWDWSSCWPFAALWLLLLGIAFGYYRETTGKAMWISVWTARPAYAATHASQEQLSVVFWAGVTYWNLGRGPVTVYLVPLVFIAAMAAVRATSSAFNRTSQCESKLLADLRAIAAAPLPDRTDRRFANWEPSLISPPSPWGEPPRRQRQPSLWHRLGTRAGRLLTRARRPR